MTAYTCGKSGYCAQTAAACTSALNVDILDTAFLAVSILLLPIISILRT